MLHAMERQDLVGFREVVDLLGVPRSTAARHVRRTDFPRPVQELAAGRVWSRTAVEAWAKAQLPIRRGRPRKAKA
jgi:predicted DNA-binding transcriptional regulator AlpA